MSQLLLLITISFLSLTTFAADTTSFHKRFEIQTNQNGEKIIVDKSLLENVSMENYIRNLASYLMVTDSTMGQIPTCKGAEYEKPDPKTMESFAKAFEWLKKMNVGKLLTEEKFLKFLNELGNLADQHTRDPDYVIMANLDNPTYFYKQEFGKFLGRQLKKLIKNQLELASYTKIITFIADDYIQHIVNKKTYHQNMLSYYLEVVPAEELGFTELEKNRARASIADSRLSFGFKGFSESKKIKRNFNRYGADQWEKYDKNSENRWEKHAEKFDARIEKIDSFFSIASYKNSPITINLSVKKDRTDDKPSFAYDDECPNFLYEVRKNYELIRVALGMSPVPYSGKLFTLFKSKYQPQAMSEGLYSAYLESTQQEEKNSNVQKQSMNPLLSDI